MKNTTVLVTGFGPFPGQPDNPSAALVTRLAAARIAAPFNLHARVLPTAYHAAGAAMARALDEIKPDIVICFGVAARRQKIDIERIAWNRANPARKDAAGHRHKGAIIRAGGPDGYRSTLPVYAIAGALARAKIPARVSDDAGDYLCNYIFYQLMHDAAMRGVPRMGGFVHIPVPREGTTLSAEGMAAAALLIVRACVRAVEPPGPIRTLRGPGVS